MQLLARQDFQQESTAALRASPQSQTSTHRAFAHPRAYWPEWCCVVAYAAILALAIPFHEPWVDEAQAWQLARNLSLPALFRTYIRYEGSPGLWHFLLWILARAHVSYTGLHWVCGAIALSAASLLIFASPFPRYLRLSLPFTFFLLFQYAVVARNYVLAPILLFALAACWKKSPFAVALILGLLANVALHAAAISGGLAVIYAIESIRNGALKDSARRSRLLVAASMLVTFYAIAIATAWPPHDLDLSRVRGVTRSPFSQAMASLLWAMCEPWVLSIPFWLAIAAWFIWRRKALYLLPFLFFALFSGEVYANWWHVGLLITLLICVLWITWPLAAQQTSIYEIVGKSALLLMIATHLCWSAYALVYDHNHAYSPDRITAQFLAPFVQRHERIAVTFIDDEGNQAFDGVGVLPYFDHNIYVNQANAFWWWSDHDTTEKRFDELLPTHPRIVLVEIRRKAFIDQINLDQPRFQSVEQAGYRFTHAYCGTFPERFQLMLSNCHVIFEYADGAPASATAPTVVPVNR